MDSNERQKRLREFFQEARHLPEGERDPIIERARALGEDFAGELVRWLTMGSNATVGSDDAQDSRSPNTQSRYPQIEGYAIKGVLGEGGMGIVYRAEQNQLHRTVALKVLQHTLAATSESAVERFEREARSAAKLHHTNIIPIYDYGTSGGLHYYAMELIQGDSLDRFIRNPSDEETPRPLADRIRSAVDLSGSHSTLGGKDETNRASSLQSSHATSGNLARRYVREVARWIADAADALDYAHKEGIIHRDIKPSNLILSGDGRIMMADFGLAKDLADQSVTREGTFIGTLRYVSPEQAMAKRVRLDHRTDIYSLGATLYELLTFQPAFPGNDQKEILGAIISRDPVPLRKIASYIPSELETITLKALEKSPDDRYQSASEMADDLRRFRTDVPIHAKRPGVYSRSAKFVRRHPARAIAAVFALSALCLTAMYFASENRRVSELRQSLESAAAHALAKTGTSEWDEADSTFRSVVETDEQEGGILSQDALARALTNWCRNGLLQYNSLDDPSQMALLDEAEAHCDQAIAIAPNPDPAWNNLGVIRRKRGQYKKAIQAFEQIPLDHELGYAALVNIGGTLALDNRLDEAEDKLTQATELALKRLKNAKDKDCAKAWRNLASIQLSRGESKVGCDNLTKARELDPANMGIRLLMARYQCESQTDAIKQVGSAESFREQESRRDPRVERVNALIYLSLGEYEKAIDAATVALRNGDTQSIDALIMAVANARLLRFDVAQDRLQEAVKTRPIPLHEPDGFVANMRGGILWIDTHQEWVELHSQAATLLRDYTDH